MKRWTAALTLGAITAGALAGAPAAHSQAASFPDIPANHWAYQAVQNLADKGLVKGYPDGRFLGKRAMTRYEFATVVDRLLQTVTDLATKAAQSAAPPAAPAGPAITQDDLNTIQALKDKFLPQLDAIQSNVQQEQDEIDALRADVLDAKTLANKAQATANNSYGAGSNRRYQISGYIQSRFIGSDTFSGDRAVLPQGTPAANSPYNGAYAQGGNADSFVVRRARLRVSGAVTDNAKYGIQLDASGIANPALTVTPNAAGTSSSGNIPTAAQAVTVREANISYTFGDGSAQNPTVTAGMFANPFGYMLPLSASAALPAEKPLAFNEGGAGLFNGQDYDRGFQIGYGPGPYRLTFALVNGSGLTSNNVGRRFDKIYRASYQTLDKILGFGVSYYDGQLPSSIVGGNPYNYAGRKKELTGVDAQIILPTGPFLLGEYIDGKYEQRSFFGQATPTLTNPLGFGTAAAPGNKVNGYYVEGGYTLDQAGNHPLTLVITYDKLRRSSSGVNGTATVAGSGSAYDDENIGYGVLYNLDKATRLRFYYTRPDKIAHNPLSSNPLASNPPKAGLFTGELQIKF